MAIKRTPGHVHVSGKKSAIQCTLYASIKLGTKPRILYKLDAIVLYNVHLEHHMTNWDLRVPED